MKTLRIPKGLWDDLEETVIHQDRQFLTEVARSLGLPIADVLRKCMGTGANHTIPVLWTPDVESTERCPWWDLHGSLWKPCHRMRLSPNLPCYKHERDHPSPTTKILTDQYIQSLPKRYPVRRNGALYWVSETDSIPLLEDGSILSGWRCKIISHEGRKIAIWEET